ncbi:MAG: hypothetical protein M3337_01300 [Actinomycetota bacterium]|nr:hypothetical protein [Actinomycetota bacterium]
MSSTIAAELASLTDAVERCRQRVSGLTEPYLGTRHDDILAALYEVERGLLGTERALRRAARLVD